MNYNQSAVECGTFFRVLLFPKLLLVTLEYIDYVNSFLVMWNDQSV